jgi:hypothetical protein
MGSMSLMSPATLPLGTRPSKPITVTALSRPEYMCFINKPMTTIKHAQAITENYKCHHL